MTIKRLPNIIMSLVVAFTLMAGSFARFHHHTHDNKACFCFTLSLVESHAKAHAHATGCDDNDSCNHDCNDDSCGLSLDYFQHTHDDYNHDTCMSFAILPCLVTVVAPDLCHTTICRRCLLPQITDINYLPSGLRAPPATV